MVLRGFQMELQNLQNYQLLNPPKTGGKKKKQENIDRAKLNFKDLLQSEYHPTVS